MARQEKTKQVRILRDTCIDGVVYKADQVIEFAGGHALALQVDGSVDPHPEAVEYALSQGAISASHVPAEQPTADVAAVADAAAPTE